MIWIAGPLQWRTQPMPAWNPPPGYALLDLRSLPDHAEGTSGRAVFFGDGPHPGSDYTLIGSGSWDDIKPTGRTLAALPRRPGFTPSGDTLRDQLLSILTDGADPAGLDGPRPILPTSSRRTEFHAGGQSLSRAFALNNSTHANRVRDVLRADFAAIHADATGGRTRDPEIHRRVLDYWCRQYGIEDWREFVPTALRAHIPGRLPHETIITDSFNRADGSLGTSAEGWSWSAVTGTWGITSNQAGKSADSNVTQLARADTDLSSADQRAQIKRRDADGNTFQGPACRVSSSAATCYFVANYSGALYLAKLVSGIHTNIGYGLLGLATNDVYKAKIDGSTLTGYCNNVEVQNATDTSVTGNLRCGIIQYGTGSQTIDDFEAADLLTHYTVTAGQGSFSLSGQAAGLKAGRTVTAAQGSFSLNGQAAGLKAGRILTAAQGSFATSGQDATLKAGRAVTASVGTVTLSGQDAGLLATSTIVAETGSFAIAGQSAALLRSRTIAADAGTLSLTGQNAGLGIGRILPADAGTFTLSGQDATLLAGRTVTASVGTFTLNGQDAGLHAVRTLTADLGMFAIAGQNAGLAVVRRLTAAVGNLTLTMRPATLRLSGRIVPGGIFRRPAWSWSRLFRRDPAAWRRVFVRPPWSLSRTWRYAPMSSRIEPTTLTKPASEDRWMAFDLSTSPEARAGETFDNPEVLDDGGLTLDDVQINASVFDEIPIGEAVLVLVSGGSAGSRYDVAVRVEASGGSRLVLNGRVAVTADA